MLKEELEQKSTKFGVKLNYMVKSGIENPNSSIGLYAGDNDCYSVFKPVMDYVIKKYHKFDPDNEETRGLDAKLKFTPEDETLLTGKVKTTRIRVARNLADFPFPSSMNK